MEVVDPFGRDAPLELARLGHRPRLLVDSGVVHVLGVPHAFAGAEVVHDGVPPRVGVVAGVEIVGVAIRPGTPLGPGARQHPLIQRAQALPGSRADDRGHLAGDVPLRRYSGLAHSHAPARHLVGRLPFDRRFPAIHAHRLPHQRHLRRARSAGVLCGGVVCCAVPRVAHFAGVTPATACMRLALLGNLRACQEPQRDHASRPRWSFSTFDKNQRRSSNVRTPDATNGSCSARATAASLDSTRSTTRPAA